ncbi:uncharacterized protein LOC134287369 [Aedes albopictus]|uniref:Odorant receptor n=1 Tax=Aedes albopictus TaxID=7160 RepID=A0ABM1YCR9_AEDAL
MCSTSRVSWNQIRSKFDKIRQLWSDEEPRGDCFWLLDLITLIGGNKGATTSRFKGRHYIRFLSNSLFAYQGFVFLLQVIHSLHNHKDDVALVVFEVLKLFIYLVSVSKMVVFAHLRKPIATIRDFVIGNSVNSGSTDFDEFEQRNFNHYARTTMKLSIGLMLVNFVAFSVPNSVTEKALGLPPLLQGFGQPTSSILRCLAVNFMPFGIVSRFFTNFTTVVALLLGMRAKLRMLAYRYAQILVHSRIDADYTLALINRDIRETLNQQLEYWRVLHDLKHLVGNMFFLVHYSSIFTVGAFMFIAQHTGVNIFSATLASGATFFLLEHYFQCRLIDTLQDEVNSISYVIYELCAKLPYSRTANRSEYVQMRSSLMIISMNTSGGVSMSCFGISNISTLTFVDLAHTAYIVLTFFISIG